MSNYQDITKISRVILSIILIATFIVSLFIYDSIQFCWLKILDNYNSDRLVRSLHQYQILTDEEIERLALPDIEGHSNPVIIRDEKGKLFYVYKMDITNPDWYLWEKPEKELRAYFLGKDLFNIAEIRVIHYGEVKGTALGDWMENNWDINTPLVVSRLLNNYEVEELAYKKGSPVWLPVFYTFIADVGDHLKSDARIGGKPRDLEILIQGGIEHYLSNDHDSGLHLFDDAAWDIEIFADMLLHPERREIYHNTWVWVFDEDLNYEEMGSLIVRLQTEMTDEKIHDAIFSAAELLPVVYEGKPLEMLVDNLEERCDVLRSAIEYLVWEKTGSKINLFLQPSEVQAQFGEEKVESVYKSLLQEYIKIESMLPEFREVSFWKSQLDKILSYAHQYAQVLDREGLFEEDLENARRG